MSYSYLLGQYLGDGHLLMTQKIPLLSVACDDKYPALMREVGDAMLACGARTVRYRQREGSKAVTALGKHWPCLLPQHGPGKKHNRRIVLADWQQRIVDDHSEQFIRGLLHSDGCRATNTIHRHGKTYSYHRYHFSNESRDIMGLCQESLDRLGVPWRMCRPNLLSVARRDGVQLLDRYVGAKS